jgi:GntR family transcriptional regulator, uxu operon transcriptional repressor
MYGNSKQPQIASEEAVRRFIVEEVKNGSMPAGSKLPTERILAKRFRVPRSVVRKALLPLEIEGKVTRQVGRGTFVANGREEQRVVATGPIDTSPAELLDACLVCYPYMTELAVATATTADLRAIEQCLQLLPHTTTLAEYGARDAAFHQAIANATHNALLIQIARIIGHARERTDWGELTLHEGPPQDHEGILEALIKRDAKLARERTKAHLLYARRSLLGGTG